MTQQKKHARCTRGRFPASIRANTEVRLRQPASSTTLASFMRVILAASLPSAAGRSTPLLYLQRSSPAGSQQETETSRADRRANGYQDPPVARCPVQSA